MFTLNTKVSGNFKVYIPDNYGNLDLIADADNLITDGGLNGVTTKTWAESFTAAFAGSGTTTPTVTDTTMTALELQTTVQPSEPASYTLSTYSSTAGATYSLGRTFKLTNTTGATKTINELGTGSLKTGGGYDLFSKVKLPSSFTLANNKFAYIVYELRLATGISTTRQIFQVSTDGSSSTFFLPTNSDLGLFNCPFATILPNGTVTGKTFASGQALFEPSNSNFYLYKINAAPAAGYFTAKRDFFENPANLITASNTAGTAPAYTPYSASGHLLQPEDATYVANSFKRSYHLIVSPTTPPPATPEGIYGFAISNTATAGTVPTGGLHCIFPSKWDRPINSFFKIYFEQNWSR
jgi:hypothetical protein